MKRSEMIEIITRVILNSESEFRLDKEEAELLLKVMEDNGMLPPYQNKDVEPPCAVMTYWEEE